MKQFLQFCILLSAPILLSQTPCVSGMAGGFPCNGLTLQGHISIANLGGKGYGNGNPMEAQDSWGWTDPQDNKEYALVTLNDGIAFVDISTPTSPRFLGKLNSTFTSPNSSATSWWHDVKVYNNYAYIVSEATSFGMQIFDLTRLRNLSTSPIGGSMRIFTRDGLYNGVSRTHNLIINEDTGYLYLLGSNVNGGGPRILNLNSNPTSPTVVGNIATWGYCHDAQVVVYDGPDPDYQGREILVGAFGNNKKVNIIDVTNKNSPTLISSVTYTNMYYTHQGWFTEDKRFFIAGDEVDEETIGINTRTLVFDLNDLDNPSLHYSYSGPTSAIDHNGYVVGNRFYLANYNAGMRILKVDDLYNSTPSMAEINYFDTFPSNNNATFFGAWNVYPFFKSGNIIVSDLVGGLFIVKDPNFDNVDPVAICQNYTATLDKNTGSITILATDIDNGSTDNFGITKRTITAGQTTFTCKDVGQTFNVTLTVEDDYANKSSCTATVTVAAATTTYSGSSWSNGAPGPGSNAKISSNYNTATTGSIDACTCEVDATKTLTVAAEDYLNITKDITVNGDLIVEHKGSVVQSEDDAVVTNNGLINVNYTTPYMLPKVFVVMGSPMTAETRNGAFGNSYMFLNHLTENFVPNPDVAAQFPGAENFADDNRDNWISYTGAVNVAEGYIARPQLNGTDGNQTYNMTFQQGTLNTGDIDFTVKYNGNPNSSPNVLANPYPSAISAIDFINSNTMVNEVYFWNPNTPPSPLLPGAYTMNFSMEDISMYNLMGGTPAPSDPAQNEPSGYISTGQGFGIKATAAGTATFTNAMRVTGNNNTAPRPAADGNDRIWVQVKNDQYQMQNNTLIGFSTLTTAGMDQGYDSRRLATVLSLYTHFEDGSKELGIQSREAFEDGAKVLMGFSSLLDESLDYTISIKDIQGPGFDNATVFLIDNELNILTNLSQESYTFKAEKGTYDRRFTLQFRSNDILGDTTTALEKVTVYPNPTSGILNIISPEAKITTLEIFDISGRRLKNIDLSTATHYEIDMTHLQNAIYFVKINTDMGSVTKQIIKQ
ncbi:MAG TPA: choice-of-anchor B family protein [Aequorivita sp.]|nr:choice-of-anchor B family protein [Aequorivita sp.]